MMVWKFPIAIGVPIDVEMPIGSLVLCAQVQGENACIWALVDPKQPKDTRRFQWFGTGHEMGENDWCYIGTIQLLGGGLMYHLFEDLDYPRTAEERNYYDESR